MKLNKYLIFIFFLTLPQLAKANSNDSVFLQRIHEAKMLVEDIEPRSVRDISEELHETASPEGNLQIFEAVAATYNDLVTVKDIVDEKGKKDLYDQIRLNVAFIQFGGDPNSQGGKKIDRWIRQALMKYLPRELMNDDEMFHSADEWKK